MSTIHLTAQALNSQRAGHPWIFRNSIASIEAASGDVVTVLDHRKRFVGRGFYSGKSKIAVRLFSYEQDEINDAFWRQRVQQAFNLRQETIKQATGYRIVSSEADAIPGLIVDRYNDHLVIQTLCPGVERLRERFVEFLQELMSPVCILERNDVESRTLEGLEKRKGILYGELRAPVEVREGEIRYEVDLLEGQKTGAYLDQRENRMRSRDFATGQVLDGFCYQGGFALHQALAAEQVLAVDSSAPAIEKAQRNAQLNGLRNLEFRKAKVFDLLRELKGKKSFDLISIDPPAFAKSARDVESAERGYREINLRALELLNPGGYLITSSCSYHMTEERLLRVLMEAAGASRRWVRLIEKRGQSKDHPVLLNLPESFYLKCIVLQVMG